jgi:hypothetical protein
MSVMITLATIFTLLLVGSVFMVVELYKAPHGMEDENGFTIVQPEQDARTAGIEAVRVTRKSKGLLAEVHDGAFASHAR